jgi:hypothetical protein
VIDPLLECTKQPAITKRTVGAYKRNCPDPGRHHHQAEDLTPGSDADRLVRSRSVRRRVKSEVKARNQDTYLLHKGAIT